MFGESRNLRYFIGFGLLIALLFIVIILIVHHGNGSSKVPVTQKPLISYADDSNVTISETIVGPINASAAHDQIDIDVTNQTTVMNISKGYDNNVTASKSYPMTTSSFTEFLSALQHAGFTNGNAASDLKDDKGYCPTGHRYIYEIRNGSSVIERYWATDCNAPKSYKGNLNLTINLFNAQVPDYNSLINNTEFEPTLFGISSN